MFALSAYSIESRLSKDHHLVKIYHLLDWHQFAVILHDVYGRGSPVGGVVPYDPLKMFRAMILQAWHSLSDPEMEQALKVRMDFIWFTDFDIQGEVPDETTICRFRHRLINKKLDKRLFAELNRQLAEHNIMVKEAKAAIVDASVIESAARPKQTVEEIPEDRREDDTVSPVIKQSADPDATWLKKGKKSYFGYKLFAVVDEDGFCRHTDMTPANRSEVGHFAEIVKQMPKHRGMRVYSDKGNASQANRELLKALGLKDGVMHKAARNRPLTKWERRKNRLVSELRFLVEQGFGTLKRPLRFARASYFGQDGVHAQAMLKMMCLNLKKAANMIDLIDGTSISYPAVRLQEAI